jgi:hypothetical protein
MKIKLLFISLAVCVFFDSCKNPDFKSFSFTTIEDGFSEEQGYRVHLSDAKYGFLQIDEFECSSNCDFPYFGYDLCAFKNYSAEYSDAFRLASSLDTTRNSEWGEWVSRSAYMLSYQKRLYGPVPTYECSFNVYDFYVDKDSVYVLRREFGPSLSSFEKQKQNYPKVLYSASIGDIESGLLKEQQEKVDEERSARYDAEHEAKEARRKLEENTINGQQLKEGEKIVKIEWNEEVKASFTRDSEDDFRFSSLRQRVPDGKIWILLYINEDYTYENGTVWSSVPYLFIDGEDIDWYSGRDFSEKSTIHLAKARDQNFRYYSGSSVKAISNMSHNEIRPNKLVGYKGYLWFLEVPE